MMWDASQAYRQCISSSRTEQRDAHASSCGAAENNRYDVAAKNALVAAGGTGFTFPACTANAFVAGTNYPGSSQVSFNGYVPYALRHLYATF